MFDTRMVLVALGERFGTKSGDVSAPCADRRRELPQDLVERGRGGRHEGDVVEPDALASQRAWRLGRTVGATFHRLVASITFFALCLPRCT